MREIEQAIAINDNPGWTNPIVKTETILEE
jgi:hypothetical protein